MQLRHPFLSFLRFFSAESNIFEYERTWPISFFLAFFRIGFAKQSTILIIASQTLWNGEDESGKM